MYPIFLCFPSSWSSKEYWVKSITGHDIVLTATVLFDPPLIRLVEPKLCNSSVILCCDRFSILDILPFSTATVSFHALIMLAAALLFIPPLIRLVKPFSTAAVFNALIIRFVKPWFCNWWSVSYILSFCEGLSVSDILSFSTAAVLSSSQLFNPFIHFPINILSLIRFFILLEMTPRRQHINIFSPAIFFWQMLVQAFFIVSAKSKAFDTPP